MAVEFQGAPDWIFSLEYSSSYEGNFAWFLITLYLIRSFVEFCSQKFPLMLFGPGLKNILLHLRNPPCLPALK
jgi:hypothetical protein